MRPGTQSRRRFLGVAALGTTAMAAVAVAGRAEPVARAADDADVATFSVPLVAFVRDASRGEIVFLAGERELVRRDRRLAAQLIAIAREERNDVVAS